MTLFSRYYQYTIISSGLITRIFRSQNLHALLTPTILFYNLLISPQVRADLDEDSLFLQLSGNEELISIATGTPRPVSKAPAVASVITAENIRNSGAISLKDVLEQIPGLHIVTSKARSQSPIYSFRGINTAHGPQTLFLLNGHEITFLMTGGLHLGMQLPLVSVARIEIIRGSGSAVYGADAFAGVINIITKTDDDIDGLQAGIKTGSFNTQSIWGQYGEIHDGWHVAASVEHKQSDGDSSRIIDSDLQTTLDTKFGTSVSHAPGPMNTDYESLINNFTLTKNHWTLHLNSWHSTSGTGAGITNVLDPTGSTGDLEQYLFDVSYEDENWQPDWSLKTEFSHLYLDSQYDFNMFPAGATLPIGVNGNLDLFTPAGVVNFPDGYLAKLGRTENTSKLDITALYTGWQHHIWRFNIGAKREDFESRASTNFGPGVIVDPSISPVDGTLTSTTDTPLAYIPNKDRRITFTSIQDEWIFATDWQLIAGIRYDDYSDFGDTINPRASLIWNTHHDLTSKFLYNRAFRAPSFAELYAQNNPVSTGNINLKAEVINTYELVFDYKPVITLNLIFNLFYYEIDGLINFVDDDGIPGGSSMAQNTIDQKANGFELEAKWQTTKLLRLFGSSTFQNADNMDTGNKVADAPRKQLHLGANWQYSPQWSCQLDGFAIMDRPRAAGDSRAPIDDYNWLNLSINGRKIYQDLSIQLAVRNLFDSDAREPGPATIPNDYPLEGRSIYLGLSSQF